MALFEIQDTKPTIPESKKMFDNIEFEGKNFAFFEGNTKSNLNEIFPQIKKGNVVFYYTDGAWSSHHVLGHLLEKTGAAHVSICTWAISENPTRKILQLKEKGLIKSLKFIIDTRIHTHSPTTLQLLKSIADKLTFTNVHAKITVITNDNWHIVHLSSANYTSNPRVEAGTILSDKKTSQMFLKKFKEIEKSNDTNKRTTQ